MSERKRCPWCGASYAPGDYDKPCCEVADLKDQITQLQARNEKLEDFRRAVVQAHKNESSLDGFERKVLEALTALDTENPQ